MAFRPVTPAPAEWDQFVAGHPRAHLLQTSAWGDLKAAFGWEPLRVALQDDAGRIAAGAQLLLRRLPFHLGTLAYSPYGPLVNWDDAAQVAALLSAVDTAAKQHGAAFLKIEPGYYLEADLAHSGFRPSPQTVQPPRTYMIDISGSEDAILARMNQGTRRNIRKSAKYEVEIREGTRDDVANFNALMHETGARDEFGVHAPEYYACAYDLFVPRGQAALFLASHAGQDLAGVMVFALGEWAWYLYGASSDRERQRMASYGVQWAGIQWARSKGAAHYDMVGVPDAEPEQLEAQFETRSDGLWGVYRFKRGWGGEVIRSVGAWDRVYNPLIYAAYKLALRRRESS
ncbi:MAG TPA: peptidoglycan bridge formation glycyltransferase FemA/FemB family protein [Aggregatilinea sp.]|uniref:lipid II:glycine glycyltransferase FemX n=1 Tax=Aggregatilinea sp. TaxID=2806333 RepID=UPI002B7F4790|nr:peptidoglycan bridge formation glycyltransferase FemA/FemB family protein [Aggregatilinea sp.]HML24938.1 peptidoglycan bridge formation glycyltransferase FemA/FemB family protein [Aggregatilinea sp.]